MNKYKASFNNNEYQDESEIIGVFDTLDEAIDESFEYLDDRFEGDFDGDSMNDIKNALRNRMFYVVGYGDSDITIEEI